LLDTVIPPLGKNIFINQNLKWTKKRNPNY